MRPLFGPRTIVEAAFLVAVPVIALEVGLGWPEIVGAGAVAYALVLAFEGVVWKRTRGTAPAPVAEEAAPIVEQQPLVRVIRTEPEPQPELVAVAVAAVPEPPPLAPVPAPPPAPEPVPAAPDPEPQLPPATTVVSMPRSGPQRWNLWDLERLVRESAGADPLSDEERTFLLMYLRDFAGPDGLLPADFDELVRQSFGALLG